jgi:signal transduction histidine kinase
MVADANIVGMLPGRWLPDTDSLFDWAVPVALRTSPDVLRRARLFAAGHFVGGGMGLAVVGAIHAFDPQDGARLWVLATGVALFLLYPFALRLAPQLFDLLTMLSLEQLVLLVLFGAYHYGNAFLPWLVPIPIVVLLHFGPRLLPRIVIIGGLALQLLAFFLIRTSAPGHDAGVPTSAIDGIGALSIPGAMIYATMMSSYYIRTVAARHASLERESEARRQAIEDAERANRAKAHFLANMNDELRTPLSAIIGLSEIVGGELKGPVGNVRYAGYARDIARSGRGLLRTIGDLLDLARIASGTFELIDNDFDLSALVAAAVRQIRLLAKKRSVSIHVSGPLNIWFSGDEPRIKQVLMNLLSNAVEASARRSRIEVTIGQEASGGAVIVITAGGVTLRPEDIERSVQPFEEMARTAAIAGGRGIGLSLPLAYQLVMQHGGTLSLESVAGRGMTATIMFPPSRLRPSPRLARAQSTAA